MLHIYRKQAYRHSIVQVVTLLILSLFWLLLDTKAAFISVLCGGVVWILPHLLFTWRVFGNKKDEFPHAIIRDFFTGEMLKLVSCAFLVILAVKYYSVQAIPFLCGMAIVIAAPWFFVVFIYSRKLNL